MRAGAIGAMAAAALLVAASAPAAGDRTATTSLRLASFAPLTVRGTGFRARESVRVDLIAVESGRRRVVATSAGSFTARFDGVAVTRCDVVRAIAVGSRGSRAGLKYLPSPACMPA